MTYINARNKIETEETNPIKLGQQIRRMLGYNPVIGWNDLIVEYTRMGYIVIAEYDQKDNDFNVILNIHNKDGSFYKQIIEE